jgi:hypothetical protein
LVFIHSICVCCNLIISILCLYINLKYIHNFLFKINRVIDYNNDEFIYNILIIIYSFIFLLINIIYWIDNLFIRKKENNNEIQRNIIPNRRNTHSRDINIQNNIENQINNFALPIEQIEKSNKSITSEDMSGKNISSISDNISLNKICIICYKNPIKVIFIPCKHRCYCNKCYNECKEKNKDLIKNCPICKSPIVSTIKEKLDKTFDVYFEK